MSVDRAARVANGSRRKRDLAAVGADPNGSTIRTEIQAWIDANLPGESHYVVGWAFERLRNQGKPKTAENVRELLHAKGWLKEQNS